MKQFLRTAVAGLALAAALPAAHAQGQPIKLAMCYDISKAYTFVTPQIIQAAKDYATLVNARGGIEGQRIEILVQDHGNEPQRGIECYEKLKREGALVFDTLSTPVSRAVLPRVMADGNVLLQSFVGRGDAIDGEVFKWVFPIGPTYWGQAANSIDWIKKQKNNSLKGVKVAFLYMDYPFGQEPIPVLKTLSEREGFDLGLFPYPLPGNDQSSAWTQIRRFNPDYIIHWGFSNGHQVASREMRRNGIPLDKFISVNWLNETDIANLGGEAAKGVKRNTNVVGGVDVPLMQEIIRDLYGKNLGAGDRKMLNDVYYNTGLAMYSIVFEGLRNAIRQGGLPLTPEKVRVGMESLKGFDGNGLMAPVTTSARDHGGGGRTRVDMWDGQKWVPQGEWTAAYQDVIWEVVKKYSAEFAKGGK